MGFEDEAEQSFGRPCRQTNGRSKLPYVLTSSIVPGGTSSTARWGLEFSPIVFDLMQPSCCCGFLGPPKLGAVNRVTPCPGRSAHVAHIRKTDIERAFFGFRRRRAKATMSAEIRRDPTWDRGIDRDIEYADMGSPFGQFRTRP